MIQKIKILIKRNIADLRKGTIIMTRHIPIEVIDAIGNCVMLNDEVQIYKSDVRIGDYTYINGAKVFYAKIGKYCSLGYGIILGGGEHNISSITTYPLRARVLGELTMDEFPEQRHCIIGNGVWIGNNVIVKQGVTIGNGAVIGSGAVVTRDIPPYAVAVGVPARVIRFLFSNEDIQYLEDVKWWNWQKRQILECSQQNGFKSIGDFKVYCESEKYKALNNMEKR